MGCSGKKQWSELERISEKNFSNFESFAGSLVQLAGCGRLRRGSMALSDGV